MLEGILSSLIASSITGGFGYRNQIIRRFKFNLLMPNKVIRITMSCILKIENQNKYLLIRNINRPENFAPIGGVIKYLSHGVSELNKIDWKNEIPINEKLRSKINRDLRGYIPARNLFKFLKWFLNGVDREENCLYREFNEELSEIGFKGILRKMATPEFQLIRTVSEGPYTVTGKSFLEFRLFKVYEFSEDCKSTNFDFFNDLIVRSKFNKKLIWVTTDEIYQGRSENGEIIGSNSPFLIDSAKSKLKDRPWTKNK